jgi:hypothetical protein
MPPPTNRNPSVANIRWSLCQTQARGARPETLTPRRDPRRFARCSTNAADSCEQHSALPGSLARPTTVPSGRFRSGSTPGRGSDASRSAWPTRASTSNSRGTTSAAGVRRSTRPAWSTRQRARRHRVGADAVARDTAGGVGGAEEAERGRCGSCPCGVVFERWVTLLDAELGLLRAARPRSR